MRVPKNKSANHSVNFINCLSHTGDYSGQPFQLRRWQESIIRQIFGTLKDGKRKYRRVFLFLPRGNGKTELCAAIALYCLITFPPGQQIFSCGSDREQAARIFDAARQMVENDGTLSSVCTIVPSQKRIVVESKHSFYCALSSDARRKHGLAPSVVLFDEMHTQPNADLHDAMQTGLAKRTNPLFIGITTAGVYDQNHIAWQEFDYARRVSEGEITNDRYLPILYYSDPETDDWSDEKVWMHCNPALGDFLNIDEIREEFKIAKDLPSRENAFRQYHLNQWCQQATRWMPMDLWDQCDIAVDPDELIGAECWGGLDLAPVRDLSALCLLFKVGDAFKVLPFVWCCSDDIETRSRRDKAPYQQWAKAGFLSTTFGSSTDFDQIRADIVELSQKYRIKTIAADQAHVYRLCQQLSEQDGISVEWMRQGFLSLGPPTARLEKLIIDKALHHGGHPALRWCAGNVCVETDAAGNIKCSKKKSTERIDVVANLVNVIGVMMSQPEDETSVYEDGGVLWM